MILKHHPDNYDIDRNIFVHLKALGLKIPEHTTPLTVKLAIQGSVNYNTSCGEFKLHRNYLVINAGEKCSGYTNSSAKVELISVFLFSAFVREVLENIVTREDKLLNRAIRSNGQPIQFFEKLYPIDNFVMPVIMKMRIASNVGFEDGEWWEEQFYELLVKLLLVHRKIYKEVEKLPPIKFSTKTELYKRVWKAKEFIDSCFKESLSLSRISSEACISRYHFLRVFKEIFNETPHQYITRKRLESAADLLSRTEMSVTQVSNEVGFDSLGSFSWLFKQRLGVSPDIFRGMFRKHTRTDRRPILTEKIAISKKRS